MRSGSRTCRKKTQTEEEENDGRRAFKSNELKKIDRKNTAFSNRLIYRTFGTALTPPFGRSTLTAPRVRICSPNRERKGEICGRATQTKQQSTGSRAL
jgi:hypothetical protein